MPTEDQNVASGSTQTTPTPNKINWQASFKNPGINIDAIAQAVVSAGATPANTEHARRMEAETDTSALDGTEEAEYEPTARLDAAALKRQHQAIAASEHLARVAQQNALRTRMPRWIAIQAALLSLTALATFAVCYRWLAREQASAPVSAASAVTLSAKDRPFSAQSDAGIAPSASSNPSGLPDPAATGIATNAPARLYQIHVAGAVLRPGIHYLAPGERVSDAIALAGGGSEEADLNAINLAAPLKDGERVFVPAHVRHSEPVVARKAATPKPKTVWYPRRRVVVAAKPRSTTPVKRVATRLAARTRPSGEIVPSHDAAYDRDVPGINTP